MHGNSTIGNAAISATIAAEPEGPCPISHRTTKAGSSTGSGLSLLIVSARNVAMRAFGQVFAVMFGVALSELPLSAPARYGVFHDSAAVMRPQGFSVLFPVIGTDAALTMVS